MIGRRIAAVACSVAGLAAAGALQWRYRYGLNPDTVSYLEIARKAAAGDWRHAVNTYWSPLYPALLAPIVGRFGADPVRVLPAAHALQAVTIALAVAASWALPEMSWALAGIALFGASVLVAPQFLGADVLVMALCVWTVGRMAREVEEPPDIRRHLVTGAIGGAAYLAKAYFFPYFFALVLVSSIMAASRARAASRAAAYVCGFAVVASVWVLPMSIVKGRFTLGDAGTNNLIAHSLIRDVDVDAGMVGPFVRLHELPFQTAVPEHYEPVTRFRGPWHIDARHAIRLVALNVTAALMGYDPSDFPMYFPLALLLVFGVSVAASRGEGQAALPRRSRFLIVSALTGMLLFVLVHVQSRYLAPFPVMLATGIAGGLNGAGAFVRRPLVAIATCMGLVFWLFPIWMVANGARRSQSPPPNAEQYATVADWMRGHGPRYAMVGPTYDLGFQAWAARVSLVASVDPAGLSPSSCADVEASLDRVNVSAVLSSRPFEGCGDWLPIAGARWVYWAR